MRLLPLPICLITFLVIACGGQATATQIPARSTPVPTSTNTSPPITPQAATVSPTVSPAISCEEWQAWPVIPGVSEAVREQYRRGQKSDNNPSSFSKIGDGEISAEWFFTAFDLGEPHYDLGLYADLSSVIEYFAGSFGRTSMAARRGFNTQKILDPLMSEVSLCEPGESPLTCELRLHRPSFAILSLGTNQIWQPTEFEAGIRQILDLLLSKNVVTILSTKGDNLEGDHRINRTIVCLAEEYDLPLWNFWAAIQPLPSHGLQPDLEHLTYGIADFDDANAMQSAWTVRNLTALQALDAVWRGVTAAP